MIIRNGNLNDIDAITNIETECFPPEQAATRVTFEKRLKVYPNHFWVMEHNGKIVSFVNGMTTNEENLTDELMENPHLHNEKGRWLMIFGVATAVSCRKKGCASLVMKRVIEDTKKENRSGIVLTCLDRLIPFYEQFGFVNEGVSQSIHGGVQWNSMRLCFKKTEENI